VSLLRAEEQDPAAVAGMVKRVDRVVRADPLRRLQTINGVAQEPFIYDIEAGGHSIRFKPGTGDALVRLAPLVRPLVELHWVREVARRNHIAQEEQHLYRHLFGVQRTGFPGKLRDGLIGLQGGACFYCGQPLSGTSPIDHFIPWARYPNDAIENLVLCHQSCNGLKSDRIAAAEHLEAWCERLRQRADDLQAAASHARWEQAPERSSGLVRSVYHHLPDGAPLWKAPAGVEAAEPARLRRLLAHCS
jgi:5-methylcytosine-specific restriction endonuclease McrA